VNEDRGPGTGDGVARRVLVSLLISFALSACVIPGSMKVEVTPSVPLTGPKDVAVMGTRTDVVAAIEDQLGAHGFTFRRYVSRERVTQPAGQLRMGEAGLDDTKYALQVTADVFGHCAGGGFELKSMTVSLFDRATNELVFRTSATGRTERCPPGSGHIFRDVANALNTAWQR
jgi:hypothetical protein